MFEDFGLEQQLKLGKIKMWKQDKVDIVYMMNWKEKNANYRSTNNYHVALPH